MEEGRADECPPLLLLLRGASHQSSSRPKRNMSKNNGCMQAAGGFGTMTAGWGAPSSPPPAGPLRSVLAVSPPLSPSEDGALAGLLGSRPSLTRWHTSRSSNTSSREDATPPPPPHQTIEATTSGTQRRHPCTRCSRGELRSLERGPTARLRSLATGTTAEASKNIQDARPTCATRASFVPIELPTPGSWICGRRLEESVAIFTAT